MYTNISPIEKKCKGIEEGKRNYLIYNDKNKPSQILAYH